MSECLPHPQLPGIADDCGWAEAAPLSLLLPAPAVPDLGLHRPALPLRLPAPLTGLSARLLPHVPALQQGEPPALTRLQVDQQTEQNCCVRGKECARACGLSPAVLCGFGCGPLQWSVEGIPPPRPAESRLRLEGEPTSGPPGT